jgi:hypothetical protein
MEFFRNVCVGMIAWQVTIAVMLSMAASFCVERALFGSRKDDDGAGKPRDGGDGSPSDDETDVWVAEIEGSRHFAGLGDAELASLMRALEAWCAAHATSDVTFEAPTRAKFSDVGTLTVKLRVTHDGARAWVVATRSPGGSWTVEQRPRWADDEKAGS